MSVVGVPSRSTSTVQRAVLGVPARAGDPVPVADQPVDAVLPGDGAQVVEDHRPVRERRSPGQGRQRKPNVNMSESERMPGYRNRSQVPPLASRASSTATLRWGCSTQPAGRADAGQPGPHDQDVDVLRGGHAAKLFVTPCHNKSLWVASSPVE